MPKWAREDFRSPTMETQDNTPRQTTRVVAQPVNAYVRPAESRLNQLGAALMGLSRPVGAYLEQQKDTEDEAEELAGRVTHEKQEAMPPTATPAFKRGYTKAFYELRAQEAAADIEAAYLTGRDAAGFDVEGLFQQRFSRDLAHVQSPYAKEAYLKRLAPLRSRIMSDYAQHVGQQILAQRDADMNATTAHLVANLGKLDSPLAISPTEFLEQWRTDIAETYAAQGKTTPEMTKTLLDALSAESLRQGGRPDLFGVFLLKDKKTGLSLVDTDARLGVQVEDAIRAAEALYDKNVKATVYQENGDFLVWADEMIRQKNFAAVSDEVLDAQRTPYGALWDNETNRALREKIAKAKMAAEQDVEIDALVADGTFPLWRLAPDAQRRYSENLLAPELTALGEYWNTPNPEAVTALVGKMDELHNQLGASEQVEPVKRMIGTLNNLLPDAANPEGAVPSRFQNIVALYEAMKASPNGHLADLYFNDTKSRVTLDNYLFGVNQLGLDARAAYKLAYRATDDAERGRAAEWVRSREGAEVIAEAIRDMGTGVGVAEEDPLPNLLRTHGGPFGLWEGSLMENDAEVEGAALPVAIQYLTMGGQRANLEAFLTDWRRANWMPVKALSRAVRVPPGRTGKAVGEAFSEFVGELQEKYKTDTKDFVFSYREGQGMYDVISLSIGQPLGQISFDEIMEKHASKRTFKPEEGATIAALQRKVSTNTLTAEDVAQHRQLIDKATVLKAWKGEALRQSTAFRMPKYQKADTLVTDAIRHDLKAGPVYVQYAGLPTNRPDVRVARSFAQSGDVGAALTALGEGVRTRAYQDPATGINIGMGYSLDGNPGTVKADLLQAGIKASVEDLKSGKAAISIEQAMRLYKVVQPRYEEMARKAFDGQKGKGAFDGLNPNSRAVLTDIAYQAGGKVAQFTKLFDAMMAKEKTPEFSLLNIFFRDRKTGQMKLDARRTELRRTTLLGQLPAGLRMKEKAEQPATQ